MKKQHLSKWRKRRHAQRRHQRARNIANNNISRNTSLSEMGEKVNPLLLMVRRAIRQG